MRSRTLVTALLVVLAGCGAAASPVSTNAADGPASEVPQEFDMDVERNGVSECGMTCRRVNATATLTNVGENTARNVTTDLKLYVVVGELWVGDRQVFGGVTFDIWTDTATLGTLEPGESASVTKEFTVDASDGKLVRNNDCELNYEMVANYDRGTKVYQGTKTVC